MGLLHVAGGQMKRLLIAVVLVWPVVVGAVEVGAFFNGTYLMKMCDGTNTGESKDSIARYNSCVAYLGGISDATATYEKWGLMQPEFCSPKRISVEQLRQVSLRYLRKHPEDWHLAGGSLVAFAFREAWPCPPPEEEKAANMQFQSCYAFLGYYNGKIDGIWGPQSKVAEAAALKAYPDLVGVMNACRAQGWTPPE